MQCDEGKEGVNKIVCITLHVPHDLMEWTAVFFFPTHKTAVAMTWNVQENNFIKILLLLSLLSLVSKYYIYNYLLCRVKRNFLKILQECDFLSIKV
jgi:hypothetical protein